jgi:hypothetical protein
VKARRKLDLKMGMSGGGLIAVLVGVLLIAALIWWMMQPGSAAVSGKVTVDGQPVPIGTISFAPTGGTNGAAMSLPIIQGEYASSPGDELGSGPYKVRVLVGTALGPPLPEISSLPAFASLNGATFEKSIDTSSGDENLFVFEFAASEAKMPVQATGDPFSVD